MCIRDSQDGERYQDFEQREALLRSRGGGEGTHQLHPLAGLLSASWRTAGRPLGSSTTQRALIWGFPGDWMTKATPAPALPVSRPVPEKVTFAAAAATYAALVVVNVTLS